MHLNLQARSIKCFCASGENVQQGVTMKPVEYKDVIKFVQLKRNTLQSISGMTTVYGSHVPTYSKVLALTFQMCSVFCGNTLYFRLPPTIDKSIQQVETGILWSYCKTIGDLVDRVNINVGMWKNHPWICAKYLFCEFQLRFHLSIRKPRKTVLGNFCS